MRPETPFLQQVRQDFKNILLNTLEFGRTCLWDGEPLQIVEDANLVEQRPETVGVNDELKRIVCRDVDLVPPKVGQEVRLDGEPWYVVEVRSPFGHLIITLGRRTA